jgi:hypothetical protein
MAWEKMLVLAAWCPDKVKQKIGAWKMVLTGKRNKPCFRPGREAGYL